MNIRYRRIAAQSAGPNWLNFLWKPMKTWVKSKKKILKYFLRIFSSIFEFLLRSSPGTFASIYSLIMNQNLSKKVFYAV